MYKKLSAILAGTSIMLLVILGLVKYAGWIDGGDDFFAIFATIIGLILCNYFFSRVREDA